MAVNNTDNTCIVSFVAENYRNDSPLSPNSTNSQLSGKAQIPDLNEPETVYSTPSHRTDSMSNYLCHSSEQVDVNTDSLTFFIPAEFDNGISIEEDIGQYNLRPVNKNLIKPDLSMKALTPSTSVCLGSTSPLPAKRMTEDYQSGSKPSSSSPQLERKEKKPYSKSGLETKQNQKRNVVFDVLSRLSRSKMFEDGQRASEDMRQYWMADRTCKECYECGHAFTTFRRRHHCRICGQIFCAKCCNEYAPGHMFGLNTDQRVCLYCHRVIRDYAQTTSGTADMNNFLIETRNMAQQKPKFLSYSVNDSNETHEIPFTPNFTRSRTPVKISLKTDSNVKVANSQGSLDIDPSHMDVVEEDDQLPIAKDTLLAVWMKMQDLYSGLNLQTQRHRFKQYHNVITGAQVVDWLMHSKIAETQHFAENIGKALVEAKWLTPATSSTLPFKYDNRPYNLQLSTDMQMQDSRFNLEKDKADPPWLQVNDFNDEDDELFDIHKDENLNSHVNRREYISKRDLSQHSVSNFHLPPASKFDSNQQVAKRNSMATKLDEGASFVDAFLGNSYMTSPNLPFRRANSLGQLNIKHESDFPIVRIYHFGDSVDLTVTDSIAIGDKINSSTFINKRIGSDPCALDKTMYLDWTTSNSGSLNDHHASIKGIYRKSFHEFDESEVQKRLDQYTTTHLSSLMLQELQQSGLSSNWFDVLMPIIIKISQTVRLNLQHDEVIDIRKYVKFKKLPGGARSDSEIVYGVVCSKNLTSKHTQKHYHKPKILLLRCAFEFERKENKFSSFDMLLMQEKEYISNLVNKVLALDPNLVIVERSVARIAQEMLIDNGITLVTNMKPSVINRIARSTAGHQLVSLDQLFWEIQLGVCKKFFLKTFTISEDETKTLMFFEGCPPVLGCCVCLRGGKRSELIKVKRIANFLLLAAYNLHLENAFIRDTYTKPLPLRSLPKFDISPDYRTPPSSPRLKLAPAIHKVDESIETIDPLSGESLYTEPSEELGLDLTAPFYKVFDKHIFTLSPHLVLSPPYLHTFNGTLSKVRKYLPNMLYWSNQFELIDESFLMNDTNISRDTLCHSLMQVDNMSIFRGLSFVSDGKPNVDKKKGKHIYKKFENNYSNSHECYTIDSSDKLPPGFIKGVTFKPNDHFSSSTSHWFVNAVLLGTAPKKTFDALLANYRATAQFSHLGQDQFPAGIYQKGKQIRFENDSTISTSPKSLQILQAEEVSTEKIEVLPNSDFLELDHHEYLEDFTYSTKRVDCFDMKYHQKIPVLFSSKSIESPNWPSACIKPWVIVMDFYGKRDIDLYNFLMRYCFRPNYNCLSDKCRVKMNKHIRYFAHGDAAIFLRTNVIKELSSEFEHIRTWGQCVTCKSLTPISILSPDAQAFSFAKFLELKFYGKHLIRRLSSQQCNHPVFSDQIQFFSYGKWIAAFEYQKLSLKDVVLPSSLLTFDAKAVLLDQNWAKELKFLNRKMAETFHALYCKLEMLKNSQIGETTTIAEYKLKLAHEETDLLEKVKSLIAKADEFGCFSSKPDESQHVQNYSQSFYKVNLEYLQDHLAYIKGVFSKTIRKWNNMYQGLVDSDSSSKQKTFSGQPIRTYSDYTPTSTSKEFSVSNTILEEIDDKSIDSDISETECTSQDPLNVASPISSRDSYKQASDNFSLPSSPVRSSTFIVQPTKQLCLTAPSMPEVVGEIYPQSPQFESPAPEMTKRQMSEPPNYTTHKIKSLTSKNTARDFNEKKRPSIQKGIFTPVPLPFNLGEHFTLECGQIPLAIYESEPSSIIAYGLNSPSYKEKLNLILRREKAEKNPKRGNNSGTFSGDLAEEDQSIKSDYLPDHDEHIDLEFEDSGTHFYCKVYYAQQFLRLREEIYSEGEDCFIRSLSRCVDWAARGGKTRATFRKVLDNQFIIKQMSRTEVESFVTFANGYFSYLKSMVGEQKPTALAKVLGVYRIGFRNTITNQTMKEDVLVIENLLYTYKCSKVFDLKGSLRNRYLQSNNKDSEVLLDENLLEYIGETPIFLRPHAKSVLACAIENDSAFLSRYLIMDYSLLVGINEESQQLLVGIIDYIRTFTWDKKLEMWVKSTGILGGGGKTPTVISPEKYKKRFCEAIDKYFPMVPDKWTVIGTEKIHLSS